MYFKVQVSSKCRWVCAKYPDTITRRKDYVPVWCTSCLKDQNTTESVISCSNQVLSLTTFIGAGYQKKPKTIVAFIDLSTAYDTVCRQGLICKLLHVISCLELSELINNMLSNRPFQVILVNRISSLVIDFLKAQFSLSLSLHCWYAVNNIKEIWLCRWLGNCHMPHINRGH